MEASVVQQENVEGSGGERRPWTTLATLTKGGRRRERGQNKVAALQSANPEHFNLRHMPVTGALRSILRDVSKGNSLQNNRCITTLFHLLKCTVL